MLHLESPPDTLRVRDAGGVFVCDILFIYECFR